MEFQPQTLTTPDLGSSLIFTYTYWTRPILPPCNLISRITIRLLPSCPRKSIIRPYLSNYLIYVFKPHNFEICNKISKIINHGQHNWTNTQTCLKKRKLPGNNTDIYTAPSTNSNSNEKLNEKTDVKSNESLTADKKSSEHSAVHYKPADIIQTEPVSIPQKT